MKRFLSLFIGLLIICLMIAGCSNSSSSTASYAGTYAGSAQAYHGNLSVNVKLDNVGKILSIDVGSHDETKDVGTVAIEKIPKKIVSTQSLNVDAVSGATVTGNAIQDAVADALKKAGLQPKDYGYIIPSDVQPHVAAAPDLSKLPKKDPVSGSLTVTDAKGRKVTLNMPISTYAISTMDVIDYVIPLLGKDAFNKLVGAGQDGSGGFQTYAKLYTPVVGDYIQHVGQISDHNAPFDLEMILSINPDVLIVNSAMGAHNYALEVEPQLTAAGIPIVLINVPGKDITTSAQNTIKLLGQIFQTQERASEVAGFIDEQFALIASKNLAQRTDKPTVYYEKSGYAEIFGNTNASNTGWGLVIAAAGGDNIADPILLKSAAKKGGNSTLDSEYILKSDPDYIILSSSGAGWMDNIPGSTPKIPKFDIRNRTGWNSLKAVKKGHVYELAHATSRTIYGFYACLKLACIFYPDDFKDVDPDVVMDNFFKKYMLVNSNVTGWFHTAKPLD